MYDPVLARFVSADSVVPGGNPQALNRYAYVLNNPLRYTDPTGNCAAEDKECWQKRDEVATYIGYAPYGTEEWSTGQLQHLLDWIFRGIRFTSINGDKSIGASWTAANMTDVLGGLDKVQGFLGAKTDFYLGLGDGGTLAFNKYVGTNVGGNAHPDSGVINLYLTDNSSAGAVLTTIHELAHVVDWHLGGGGFWSDSSLDWKAATGWATNPATYSVRPPSKGYTSTYHDNAREDFAETLTVMIAGTTNFPPDPSNPSRYSP